MFRIVLILLLLLHGLVHAAGFASNWKIGQMAVSESATRFPLSPAASKAIHFLWLLVAFCFLIAGVCFALKREVWWMVALIALLFSQGLILLYWPVAKWGSLPNALILIAAIAKIDQGALQRYVAEICWLPSAALLPCIKWEALDSFSAKATMTYKNTSGSVIFHFNNNGDLLYCTADRYKGGGKNATLELWEVRTVAYGNFTGIRMPVKSEVTWKLKTGDFTWYKLELTALEYNHPKVYE